MINRILAKIKMNRIKKQFAACGSPIYIGKGHALVGTQYISIGDHFLAEEGLRLQAWTQYRGEKTGYIPELKIGDHVSMMSRCQISCASRIVIGDDCLFGDNVFITDNFHGNGAKEERELSPLERKLYVKGPVILGKNVWVGRNVCIMPGVTIGDGAVIGANAVVTKDVPAGAVAAGAPARIIRTTE